MEIIFSWRNIGTLPVDIPKLWTEKCQETEYACRIGHDSYHGTCTCQHQKPSNFLVRSNPSDTTSRGWCTGTQVLVSKQKKLAYLMVQVARSVWNKPLIRLLSACQPVLHSVLQKPVKLGNYSTQDQPLNLPWIFVYQKETLRNEVSIESFPIEIFNKFTKMNSKDTKLVKTEYG